MSNSQLCFLVGNLWIISALLRALDGPGYGEGAAGNFIVGVVILGISAFLHFKPKRRPA